MSSHHFVREDQEPALIIADVNGISLSLLNQLLEWNPMIILDRHSLDSVMELGIKADVLVADEPVELSQDHIRILPIATSFLDTALNYLIKRRCRAANIVSTHTMPDVLLRYAAKIQAVLLGNGRRVFTVKSGFAKWKPQGEKVFLYGDSATEIKGLRPTGEREYLTETDGFYSIHFDQPYGLVGEQL
jgi:hypothetical protein